MNRRKYRATWLRLHDKYSKVGRKIFRKGLIDTLKDVPFDKFDTWNYEAYIRFISDSNAIYNAYFDFYTTIGIAHGKRVAKSFNKEIDKKNIDIPLFEGEFKEIITRWLINNGGSRIVSVQEELIKYLIKFIKEGVDRGIDIRQISKELKKHISTRNFYKWQIDRIVRTETTAAANFGAVQAGESTNVIWQKEWISTADSRTRRRPDDLFDHDINGYKVDKGEMFNINGDLLEFPGDPRGQAGNVVNCRCSIAIVPKRDENGRLVYRDGYIESLRELVANR